MKHALKKSQQMAAIGSLWFDTDGGCGQLFKYKGIYKDEPFKDRMHFVIVDFKTGEESEGGTYIGYNRFLEDMVTAEGAAKHPCCGMPTLYPILWCDDCGYEAWDKARNAKLQSTDA